VSKQTDWDREEWLDSAKRLIEWVNTTHADQSIMLLIRHSHREKIVHVEEIASKGLTELGKNMSLEMGLRFPTDCKVQFWFSFISRCYETAEAMAAGFAQQGGEVIDMDPLPALVGPHVIDPEVWRELQPDGKNVTDFVNRWVEGGFGDRMESFDIYKSRLVDDTVKKLISLEEPTIHIHVTHDLAMMAVKRMIFRRPLVNEDREPYLGGLGVIVDGSYALFFTGDMAHPVRLNIV